MRYSIQRILDIVCYIGYTNISQPIAPLPSKTYNRVSQQSTGHCCYSKLASKSHHKYHKLANVIHSKQLWRQNARWGQGDGITDVIMTSYSVHPRPVAIPSPFMVTLCCCCCCNRQLLAQWYSSLDTIVVQWSLWFAWQWLRVGRESDLTWFIFFNAIFALNTHTSRYIYTGVLRSVSLFKILISCNDIRRSLRSSNPPISVVLSCRPAQCCARRLLESGSVRADVDDSNF